MKNNNLNGNQQFEKLLKDRMDKLSMSVDCFDKISARTFPEKDSDFSDSEFIVSDLENVTGRAKRFSVLKWTATAAALVLLIGILPKTAFVNNLMANLANDSKNRIYREIIAEINSEIQTGDYVVYDMPLEDYIANDVLITPLYSCPFESLGRDDLNVRIFVRKSQNILTNQIYAVEYSGSYTEDNFIAVAESSAKFTEEELSALNSGNIDWDISASYSESAVQSFFTCDKYGSLTNADGDPVTAASFDYNFYFKVNNECYAASSEFIYYCEGTEKSDVYYYDYITDFIESDGLYRADIPYTNKLWLNSVCYDGSSAMPEESASSFKKTEIFNATSEQSESSSISCFMPYPNAVTDPQAESELDNKLVTLEMHRFEQTDMGIIGTITAPFDKTVRQKIKLFIPTFNFMAYSSYSDPKIVIKGEDSLSMEIIGSYIYNCSDVGWQQAEEESDELTSSEADVQLNIADLSEKIAQLSDKKDKTPNEQAKLAMLIAERAGLERKIAEQQELLAQNTLEQEEIARKVYEQQERERQKAAEEEFSIQSEWQQE